MKELIRSLRLSKLTDIPLSDELKRLESAILFIRNIFDKVELKTDSSEYYDREFYFIADKLYFEYEPKQLYLWCRQDDFWDVLKFNYIYNSQEIAELLGIVIGEYFKCKVVIVNSLPRATQRLAEAHFKNM